MRIFATVGTQLPFDRLIRELDVWAQSNPRIEVFAQTGLSDYEPAHMPWARMISEKSFREYLDGCDAVVAHAGMGTIISAAEKGKRVIVMPRRAEFGEHRNDHQLATANRLGHLRGLTVVHDGQELATALGQVQSRPGYREVVVEAALSANPQLISEIRSFAGLGAN